MPELTLPVFPKAMRLAIFGVDGQQGNDAVITSCPDLSSTLELKTAASQRGVTSVFIASSGPRVVRFFTPVAELPFCVHGALAAGAAASEADGTGESRIIVREKNFTVSRNGHGASIVLNGPFDLHPETNPEPILYALDLENADIAPNSPIVVASAGSPKWLVHVAGWEKLRNTKPKLQNLAEISQARGVNGAYVFATSGAPYGSTVAARAFNPAAGVNEDAATGVAAAALAWTRRETDHNDWLAIDQYVGSKRSGRIRARVTGDCVEVGGEVRFVKFEP
ncbi:MAG: PhzF family phenazine biosynthesis protein [Candidatus Sulfotelmatobacter sp.]